MAKWADYLVSAVRYQETDTSRFISKLRIHEDKGDTLGPAQETTRENIMKMMDDGKTFVTIYKGGDEKWKKGEDIHKVVVNNKTYLRTDKNKTESDNLGELPEF